MSQAPTFPEGRGTCVKARPGAAWPMRAVTVCGGVVSGPGSSGESCKVGLGRLTLRDLVICGLSDNFGAGRLWDHLCFV